MIFNKIYFICGGTGALEVIYTGGGPSADGKGGNPGSSLNKCPTCRGVQIERRLYYR